MGGGDRRRERHAALKGEAMARPAASSLALLMRRPDEIHCKDIARLFCDMFRLRWAFSVAMLVLIVWGIYCKPPDGKSGKIALRLWSPGGQGESDRRLVGLSNLERENLSAGCSHYSAPGKIMVVLVPSLRRRWRRRSVKL